MATALPAYLYLILDYSTPGLLRLGRTRRSPLDEVADLESAAGVAGPLELAFDVLVPDGESGERLLRELLSGRGYEISGDGRLRAPVHEVVGLMLEVREIVPRLPVGAERLPSAEEARDVEPGGAGGPVEDAAGGPDRVERPAKATRPRSGPARTGRARSRGRSAAERRPAPGTEAAGGEAEIVRRAAEFCIREGEGSTRSLMSELRIDYGAALRLLNRLSSIGVLGPAQGEGPRRVLASLVELDRLLAGRADRSAE